MLKTRQIWTYSVRYVCAKRLGWVDTCQQIYDRFQTLFPLQWINEINVIAISIIFERHVNHTDRAYFDYSSRIFYVSRRFRIAMTMITTREAITTKASIISKLLTNVYRLLTCWVSIYSWFWHEFTCVFNCDYISYSSAIVFVCASDWAFSC